MSNYLFVALGKKANRHVFVYHLTNKQKRYVLLTFLLKKIHESKLSSCSWRKTNFSFFYDKTTSIIFKFLYFLGFFFCSMINPRISFMPFFVFIVFSQAEHAVFVDVGSTKSMRVMSKVLKIEHMSF